MDQLKFNEHTSRVAAVYNGLNTGGIGAETFVSVAVEVEATRQIQLPAPAVGIGVDSSFQSIFLQHSPNGIIYQNYYAQQQQQQQTGVEYVQLQELPPPSIAVNIFEDSQYSLHHDQQHHHNNENKVELMSQFAVDLANSANYNREQERTLLQSTMSPLLAAVNDITKRDAEMQMYLNKNLEKNAFNTDSTELLSKSPNFISDCNEIATEHSENESECLFIEDTPVDCRAKASLPTKYLQFGAIDSVTRELTVYAKKRIPQRTKLGPFEGFVLYASELDLDVLHVQTPRYYPLLMLDDTHILDTSDENNSNWMRYVRLADTFSQQNLHLLLEDDGRIFFKTTRNIDIKEELRVGYHRSYATRFLLSWLQPTVEKKTENCVDKNTKRDVEYTAKMLRKRRRCRKSLEELTPWKINLSKRLVAVAIPAVKAKNLELTIDERPMRRKYKQLSSKKLPRSPRKDATRSKKCPEKSLKVKERNFKCNLCAKSFLTQQKLEHHNTSHPADLTKPHKCPNCQQQCATPTALAAHIQSHNRSILYTCIYCDMEFKYVRDFKQHVETHQSADGTFQCIHCKKYYLAYHLVRKHVRIFHRTRKFGCDCCAKKFQNINNLQRHKLTHAMSKELLYACAECEGAFKRRDQLTAHIRRKHGAAKKQYNRFPEDIKMPAKESKNIHNVMPTTQLEPYSQEITADEPKDVDHLNLISGVSDINDGSQYLQLSPAKVTPTNTSAMPNTASTSSSNRRKQIPTKLKAVEELNAKAVTFVSLTEMLTPFFISESDLHEEFKKTDDDFCSPRKILVEAYKVPCKEQREKSIIIDHRQRKNNDKKVLENLKTHNLEDYSQRLYNQSKNFETPIKKFEENRKPNEIFENQNRIHEQSTNNDNSILEYIKPSHNLTDYFWLDDQEQSVDNGILENLKPNENVYTNGQTKNVENKLLENTNHSKSAKSKNNENAIFDYIKPSENLSDYFWLHDQTENIENGILENLKQTQSLHAASSENEIFQNITRSKLLAQQSTLELPNEYHGEIILNSNLGLQLNNENLNKSPNISVDTQITDPLPDSSFNQLYPYQCHLCSNAQFKRRGILVNHYVKLHPQLNLNQVVILNAPIVKPQLLFPCPYCRQCIYKSNAKRKAHILKQHPDQKLPASLRHCANDSTAVERLVVGSTETEIHRCEHCPRQYAARNRLVAHYRQAHANAKLPQTRKISSLEIQSQPQVTTFLPPSEINLESVYPPATISPENKLLKLSSAALEISRWDFLNDIGKFDF